MWEEDLDRLIDVDGNIIEITGYNIQTSPPETKRDEEKYIHRIGIRPMIIIFILI